MATHQSITRYLAVALVSPLLAGAAYAQGVATVHVQPSGPIATIAEAARLAKDGDTVEIQAGEYRGDVAVWPQKQLTIRAVGGRVRLIADGQAAEGKAIWVIRNGDFTIEGFDFEGARVAHKNGAGIRFEGGRLTVIDSRFIENENGILTSNDRVSELHIDRCMFSQNGHGDGYSHNLYAGKIGRLTVRASYFRQARAGHLIKSRARFSDIAYNRITDENGGMASYEIDLPNGGEARIVGNLIEQGPATRNAAIVSYGAEGYTWPENRLVFAYNTVVDRRASGGIFVKALPGNGRAVLANNLFVGRGVFAIEIPSDEKGNFFPQLRSFVNPEHYDFRPRKGADFVGRAVVKSSAAWPSVFATNQYAHERALRVRGGGKPSTPGAFDP